MNKTFWGSIGLIIATLAVNLLLTSPLQAVKDSLVHLTIAAHLILILLAIFIITKPKFLDDIRNNGTKLAFIVALIATSGSLFYSQIAGYTPCKLCWFQRIFMYPLVLLLGIAIYKKEKIPQYTIPMSIIGGMIAFYHYMIQVTKLTFSCTEGVECAVRNFFHLGYITIPLMAFTAFLLIIILEVLKD